MTEPQEGVFSTRMVAQKTGVKSITLRAWERRYGLPQPERTAGGHRRYSRRDIEIVRWLLERQKEGMRISEAVRYWRRLEAEDRSPLPEGAPPTATTEPLQGDRLSHMRQQWINACLAFDEGTAERVLAQALALYSPETVCLDLLQPAVAQVGEGWYQGRVTVQQEHFATALALRRVEAMRMAAPPPTRPDRILAACPPDEEHVFGLLLLTLLLRRQGWDVVYLGANVPTMALERTIATANPQLIVSSAQQLHTAASLMEMADALQRQEIALAYGGAIFNRLPKLQRRITGHFLGETLRDAPQVVQELLSETTPPPPEMEPPSAACTETRNHYLRRRGAIDSRLVRRGPPTGLAPRHVAIANEELARRIDAALSLGDTAYLDTEVDWLIELMRNYGLPPESLQTYLQSYRQAAEKELDQTGRPILEWLRRFTAEMAPDATRASLRLRSG